MKLLGRTALVTHLAVLLLLTFFSAALAEPLKCKKKSDNIDESPTFICAVEVTVIRNMDCSVRITERFLFPHTSNKGWRAIQAIDRVQEVSAVTLFRDDVEMRVVKESGDNNEVRVMMETSKSTEPVLFALSYNLSNAVNRFTQSCESGADSDETKNVLRWRSGKWKQSFDELSVTFQTENTDAKLAVLGDDSAAPGSTVSVQRSNVDYNIEVYASESGVELCSEDLQCFPTGFNEIPLIIALCVIGLLVICVAIWCVVRCRATHKQVANDIEDVEDP